MSHTAMHSIRQVADSGIECISPMHSIRQEASSCFERIAAVKRERASAY
jgi:hypothetical protein